MLRRFDLWLAAYAASMTLIAAWFGSRMVVYGALLAWTHGFLEYSDKPNAEGWAYHYDPAVLAERGYFYAFAIVISRNGLPLLYLFIPRIFLACWCLSRPRHGKIPYSKTHPDLSLE